MSGQPGRVPQRSRRCARAASCTPGPWVRVSDGSRNQRGCARPGRGRQPGRPVGRIVPSLPRDLDVLAVERHAGHGDPLPGAGHFHLRTVEILRSAGIEEAIRRKSEEQYPPDGRISSVESLAGREIANYFPNLNAGVAGFSPTVRFINQDAPRPILGAVLWNSVHSCVTAPSACRLSRMRTASRRSSATSRAGCRARCGRNTSSRPTETATRRANCSASACTAMACCRKKSPSTSAQES